MVAFLIAEVDRPHAAFAESAQEAVVAELAEIVNSQLRRGLGYGRPAGAVLAWGLSVGGAKVGVDVRGVQASAQFLGLDCSQELLAHKRVQQIDGLALGLGLQHLLVEPLHLGRRGTVPRHGQLRGAFLGFGMHVRTLSARWRRLQLHVACAPVCNDISHEYYKCNGCKPTSQFGICTKRVLFYRRLPKRCLPQKRRMLLGGRPRLQAQAGNFGLPPGKLQQVKDVVYTEAFFFSQACNDGSGGLGCVQTARCGQLQPGRGRALRIRLGDRGVEHAIDQSSFALLGQDGIELLEDAACQVEAGFAFVQSRSRELANCDIQA